MSCANKPIVEYFPLRGRAEVIRLALAVKGIQWEERMPADMKTDRIAYPFGQAPRFVDGEFSLVQSNAILRFIGRKYKLQGTTEKDVCQVDMLLEGVEALRAKYIALIYTDELAEEAKAKYWTAHGDKAVTTGKAGGAHLDFLAAFIRNNPSGFTTGTAVTVADLAVFEIVDLHNRIFADQLNQVYPELVVFHKKIEALEGVKAYRSSPGCFALVNANNLG